MTQLSEQPADELVLAGEFPEPSKTQWRELVEGVLRKSGRKLDDAAEEIEQLLASKLGDGVTIAPLYTEQDALSGTGVPGLAPFTRGSKAQGASPNGWDIRQQHSDPDVAGTAEAVLADLENGVTSLWLVLGEGALPVDSLPTVLDKVLLDLAPIALDAGEHAEQATSALFALASERDVAADALTGTLGVDPLGRLAAVDSDTDVGTGLRLAGELAARCVAERPNVRAVTVDATGYHNAGAEDAQELGCSLAAGVAYLRALTESGLSVEQALSQLEFRYAATADQFATIAKLRAARSLWSRVAAECGATGPEAAQRQHVVNSERMITARDPWVNMLRSTLACFGAGVGGADSVTVLPFDAALGLPDKFTRRIARNTQSLLIAESHVARVVDPAGGSWYVEQLTAAFARQAWAVFTEIERAGGLGTALGDGSLAGTLGETWARRERRLATRDEPLTGVSEFPNLDEKLPTRQRSARPAPAGVLPRVRNAGAYEALRDRSDAQLADTGDRPTVFLATLGSPSSHSARTGFATNLFQAGGLATPTSGEASTPEEIAEAFTASGTTVACVCGADKAYAENAEPVAKALRDAGASRVLLAGKPGTVDSDVFTGHVFAGCDAVEVLTSTLDELGVRA